VTDPEPTPTLVHFPLSPAGRLVRLALAEKRLEAEFEAVRPWDLGDALYDMNPAGTLPVLRVGEATVCDALPICEFLEERYPEVSLLPGTPVERAEIRRLLAWFLIKFEREVSANLIPEKLEKRLQRKGEADMTRVRAGLTNLRNHLDYITYVSERRNWLGGEALSLADFAAAAQLSSLDYMGDVPWSSFPQAKAWYVRVKSRPAFRGLLADHIPGMPPPRWYADLDF